MTFEEWWETREYPYTDKDCAEAAWNAAYNFHACKLRPMVPEGYVLVPVEPTEKMLKAGEELEYFEGGYGSTCDEFYKAMIQAAQDEE